MKTGVTSLNEPSTSGHLRSVSQRKNPDIPDAGRWPSTSTLSDSCPLNNLLAAGSVLWH